MRQEIKGLKVIATIRNEGEKVDQEVVVHVRTQDVTSEVIGVALELAQAGSGEVPESIGGRYQRPEGAVH